MMRCLRNKEASALEARPVISERGKAEGKQEGGFALVMVIFITTLLAILGATTLVMVAYSLINAQGSMPAAKAFDIAEAGISAAHAQIVTGSVVASKPYPGMMGGDCLVEITGTTPDWTITSTGTYQQDGKTYKRKIEERVSYAGSTALNFMQDYILYARNNVNIDIADRLNLGFGGALATIFTGNMRAENEFNINLHPDGSWGDGLIINGNIEGRRKVYIRDSVDFLGMVKLTVNGDIKTNELVSLDADGQFTLIPFSIGYGIINASTNVGGKIYNGGNVIQEHIGGFEFFGWHPMGEIHKGTVVNSDGVADISAMEPDFDYYKSVAKQQGNYYTTAQTLPSTLGAIGSSSVTVFYCTENITCSSNFSYTQPNMTGVFVTEKSFTISSSAKLTLAQGSKMQIMAEGDINSNCAWDFLGYGSFDQFFFSAGNDININLGMMTGLALFATAGHNINVTSDNIINFVSVKSNPNFAVDVRGWPIDMTVRSWKELPIQ